MGASREVGREFRFQPWTPVNTIQRPAPPEAPTNGDIEVDEQRARPEVDSARIGIWGTSYSGGHAIVLGATDRRLRHLVSQVRTINGYTQGMRRVPAQNLAALETALDEDERAQFRGAEPGYQALVSADPTVPASYRDPDAIAFYQQPLPEGGLTNSAAGPLTPRVSGGDAPGDC